MPLPIVRTTEEEGLHQEMERISLDWCMIQNPTDEDFYIEWLNTKGRPWKYLVPNKNKDIGWGKGKLEVQRYLAVWYCEHMKDKIVNAKGVAEYEKMVQDRRDKGQPDLTKSEEQEAIWRKTPRTTSNHELTSIYPILFLGVTREFGMDYAPDDQPEGINLSTPDQKAMEALQNKKYSPSNTEEKLEKKKISTADSPKLPSVEDLEALMPHQEENVA